MIRRKSLQVGAVLAGLLALAIAGCRPACPNPQCPFYAPQGQRRGAVIGIPSEHIPEYKRLHANTWPGVLKTIREADIRNYSIYLGEVAPDRYYLFAYTEYVGRNYKADMDRVAGDKTMQEWWTHTDPLQQPLPTRQEGEWWAQWQEVFHYSGPAYRKSDIKSRHGSIIGIDEESILAYTQMHAAVWPGVLAAIEKANIRNYSIYLGRIAPGECLLFSYFEYVGNDFETDMERMADKVTKVWWTYTDPLQSRLPGTPEGQQWKPIEEVFHMN